MAEEDWNSSLELLASAKLLTVSPETVSLPTSAFPLPTSLDAHPHLREYFARQLRTQQPDAWRAAHRRLYEHLCETTEEGDEPTLEDFQPLYQAVVHGCQAGLQQEACVQVFQHRIRRRNEVYSQRKLGAFGSDLGAIACFFEQPWARLSPALESYEQSWLLNEAAVSLNALGRLTESVEPIRVAIAFVVKQENWKQAAIGAGNLSEMQVTLGEVAGAVGDAEQSVTYADLSGDAYVLVGRAIHADALHQAGHRGEAETRFREAEQMQAERQPDYPLLYSVRGFRYCDLLLAAPERAAWQQILSRNSQPSTLNLTESCRAVSHRAAQTLKWISDYGRDILSASLDHLTLGRAALYGAILEQRSATPAHCPKESAAPNDNERRSDLKVALQTARRELDAAAADLRRSGKMDHLPRGLLTRAWCSVAEASFFAQATTDESAHKQGGDEQESALLRSRAQEDLDEAWEIADRGPMKLFMADIHLYRARLFGSRNSEVGSANEAGQYPWESPQADLAAAEKLINDCGYHRRDEELADAKAALLAT